MTLVLFAFMFMNNIAAFSSIASRAGNDYSLMQCRNRLQA